MPCPFFEPIQPQTEGATRRVPLGEVYLGRCQAEPGSELDAEHQVKYCNHGYAKGNCQHLPQDAPDAHRFSITRADHAQVNLIWIVERDHRPEGHGSTQYSIEQGRFHPPLSPTMTIQAHAFVQSYRNGKASQGLSS